jgi:hypothetical protein
MLFGAACCIVAPAPVSDVGSVTLSSTIGVGLQVEAQMLANHLARGFPLLNGGPVSANRPGHW